MNNEIEDKLQSQNAEKIKLKHVCKNKMPIINNQ